MATEVALTCGDDFAISEARAPRDFTVERSNDGGQSWATVLNVSGQTGWSIGETRVFSV